MAGIRKLQMFIVTNNIFFRKGDTIHGNNLKHSEIKKIHDEKYTNMTPVILYNSTKLCCTFIITDMHVFVRIYEFVRTCV